MFASSLSFGIKGIIALIAIVLSAITANATTISRKCAEANRQAIGFMDAGRDSEAAALLSETTRQLSELADDKFCKGTLLINLGVAIYRLGGLDAAERTVKDAFALIDQTAGHNSAVLRLPLQVLASFALRRDRLKKADELICRIEALPWDTHEDLAAEHSLRATLMARMGNKTEAERGYRAAISEWELAVNGNLPLDAISDLWNLAVLYLEERRAIRALPLLKRGLEISEAPLNPELKARVLFGLGVAYIGIDDHESAEQSFQRGIQLLYSVAPVFRSGLGQALYDAYSALLKTTGRKQQVKELKSQGESLYGRDTSGMTIGFDSLLAKQKGAPILHR